MIRKVIEFCAKNRLLVILIYGALLVYAFVTMKSVPLDAVPDLSDTQVIIYTKWDRSPDIMEDQVTYPIVTALLGAPKVKAIRGLSDFGFSYVYVIFQDGTDIYWARSRVVEYLSKLQGSLPQGVSPELGPDASGVGWVFQYALVDKSGRHDLAELRSYQDWTLKYAVQGVPGVAEVASVGGFQKQYQVTVDPNVLHSYDLSIMDISDAIKRSNNEVGGRLLEWTGREYMVRGRGYIKSVPDLEQVVVKVGDDGTPVLLRDVAQIQLGPQIRRGVADFNGDGDTVGGIVVMRHGENAMKVIEKVKAKLADMKGSLPSGVEIVTTYDRSDLIQRSIDNLKGELLLEMIIVSLVILFFLWHIPSAFVPIITIPASVLLCFIPLYLAGISSNIMSLAGIAISVGVLVDGAIVEVENAYKKLEIWKEQGQKEDYQKVLLEAMIEVAPSVFFSLLVIAVSFLPVFAFVDQEGRLFKPLAYTKTFVMLVAALLAVTLDPAVRMLFTRVKSFNIGSRLSSGVANVLLVGRYYPEEKHPVSRVLFRLYEKPCRWVLKNPWSVIGLSLVVMATTVPVFLRLGSEFMPPLNEGVILYMPTTMPGISVTEAHRVLQVQDRILRSFPEVVSVFGKAGRADTSTDPAPFSMMETTVVLKPPSEWRGKQRWYSSWAPGWVKSVLRHAWPDTISWEELTRDMDKALKIPGTVNAWTMPIKGRIDMLSTGVRTPIGIKVMGDDLAEIQAVGEKIEGVLSKMEGTRTVFAERASGGYFVDIVPKREALARYGLKVDDLQQVVMSAIGGETVSTTIERRERYSINIRYPRDLREDLDGLGRVYVTTGRGAQIPLRELADISLVNGPAMIRDENGMLAGYVYVDIEGLDVGTYVAEAKKKVEAGVSLPTGYHLVWSGQYENMMRVKERLILVIPVTLILIFVLLYMNTKSAFKALVVMLAVPFSLVGAVWLLHFLGYNMSIAVWVGMIALMGLDAETGVFMMLFLDLSYEQARRDGRLRNLADLHEAIVHGAVKRIRPKLMTVAAATMGLLPIMWSMGVGADVMKRIAAPMVGGLTTSFLMELLVYPAIYLLWKQRAMQKRERESGNSSAEIDRPPAVLRANVTSSGRQM
ncbi:MAG: CusA/CzcA family heavy metal efflux RND transporter [Verrucomicrobia bacterium]|nr:CusA/CzcA family heavy metal efflux RND transporter [Verrucomicrobiota bacterium]